MRVDESNYDVLYKATEITGIDYNIIWHDAENIDGYIDSEVLLDIIQDLMCELDNAKEKYEDLKQDLEDNYKPISHYEEYGISESDFH